MTKSGRQMVRRSRFLVTHDVLQDSFCVAKILLLAMGDGPSSLFSVGGQGITND